MLSLLLCYIGRSPLNEDPLLQFFKRLTCVYPVQVCSPKTYIPLICHFFTRAKFLENKIYNMIYTVNCQFTQ